MADIAAGMYAYSSILVALLQRRRTGEGGHIDVSMLEALAEWMSYPMYYAYHDASPPPRSGSSHATIYPYGPFATKDGIVILGIQNEREWLLFCDKVLANAELACDPRFDTSTKRNENRAALNTYILEVFKSLSTEEVEKRLDEAQIANGRMNNMAGLWSHPQLRSRDRWRSVASPAGDIPALLPPGRQSTFEYRLDPIPAPQGNRIWGFAGYCIVRQHRF